MRGEVCRALRTTEFTLTETADTRREQRRVLAGTVVGTSIEWYDFFIYAQAAGVVLGPLFFAPAGETFGQIVAWASLGISFLFRPLGAIVAGHLGDRPGGIGHVVEHVQGHDAEDSEQHLHWLASRVGGVAVGIAPHPVQALVVQHHAEPGRQMGVPDTRVADQQHGHGLGYVVALGQLTQLGGRDAGAVELE